jgi:hypothetical protein
MLQDRPVRTNVLVLMFVSHRKHPSVTKGARVNRVGNHRYRYRYGLMPGNGPYRSISIYGCPFLVVVVSYGAGNLLDLRPLRERSCSRRVKHDEEHSNNPSRYHRR